MRINLAERSEASAVNRALRARIRRKLEAIKQEATQLPRLNGPRSAGKRAQHERDNLRVLFPVHPTAFLNLLLSPLAILGVLWALPAIYMPKHANLVLEQNLFTSGSPDP